MKNLFAFLILFCLCHFAFSQVVINEYSAANRSLYVDNFGQYEDWVELHNTGSAAVNIGGFHLSDNLGNVLKYPIPAGLSIPAGGYRIFFCSDRNVVAGGVYHTNFILTQSDSSDHIIFSNASGVIIDSVKINPSRRNQSRGRATNGSPLWRVFETPTPNASNNTQTPRLEYVPKVNFSLQAGFYTGNQTLTLSCPQANTTIFYTTNGAIPTNTPSGTNLQYNGPITISANTPIRARAFDNTNAFAGSFTVTNSFFINEPLPLYPSWSMVSNNMNTFFNSGTETMISIEYFETNGQRIFQFEGDVRRHGNDSWAYSQKGMRIYVRDQYGYANKIDHQMFPTSPRSDFDVIIIKAAGSDNFPDGGSNPPNRCAHIRDAYVQTLSEKFDLNVDVRRYKPALSYINGQYWGIYDTRERVDVDYTNYYYNAEERWVDMLEYWGGLQVVAGSDTGWVNLFNFIVNNNMAVQNNYNYAVSKLDPLSLIDYFILNTYTVNSDWLNWNTAWWRSREPGNEIRWRYKLWDQDNTFNLGQNFTGLPTTSNTADPCDVETTSFATTNNALQGHVRIFNSLMNNPQFEQMYVNRYADLINTAFYCPTMLTHFDTMIARLAPAFQRHTARWGSTVAQWNTAVQFTRNQIAGRCNNVVTGLGPCYNVTGPYPVTIQVSPSCAGTVRLNSITPDQYPFTGNYYGGINITLEAQPVPGYVFSGWQFTNGHIPTPNVNADSIWLDLGNSGDSIIAVFTPTTPVLGQLTVQIQGNNPGPVVINGAPVTNGQILSIPLGSSVAVAATPQPGCTFFKWYLNNTLVNPVDTLESGSFCFRQNDTLRVVFDPCTVITPDTFQLTVLVQPVPGAGNVSINGITIPVTPIVIPVPENTLLNLAALANPGYAFSNWILSNHALAPNANSANASFTITSDDTLIAVFSVLPDTFDVTVVVLPSDLNGSVSLNGIPVGSTPTTLSYVEGTILNAQATPTAGNTFTQWTLPNHILTPNNTATNVQFTITANDTLTAYFAAPDTHQLTVLIQPGNTAGTLSINGTGVGPAPVTLNYLDGTLLNLSALNLPGFTFSNWVLSQHTLSPGVNNPNASFSITSNDTLIAVFTQNPDTFELTVVVLPGNAAGSVTLNGTAAGLTPVTFSYVDGTSIALLASSNPGFGFVNWQLANHTLTPSANNPAASFVIQQDDTLYANFVVIPDTFSLTVQVVPAGSGTVTINGSLIPAYPAIRQYQENTLLNISSTANAGYQFAYWELPAHTLSPGINSTNASFTITQSDQLTAHFALIPPDSFTITYLVFPDSACQISINGFQPGDGNYPYAVTYEEGTTLTLTAEADSFYLFDRWSIPNHAEVPGTTSPSVYFNVSTNDSVLLYCRVDYDTLLFPNPVDTQTGVVVPTAFTPNQDGSNDVFRLLGEYLTDFDMKIFNRWGESVFESNNFSRGWDGTHRDKAAPVGTYSYYFQGLSPKGVRVKGKGNVTLIR